MKRPTLSLFCMCVLRALLVSAQLDSLASLAEVRQRQTIADQITRVLRRGGWRIDLMFIGDSSASISRDEFNDAKQVAKFIAMITGVNSRFGWIRLSSLQETKVLIPCRKFNTPLELSNAIDAIEYDAGGATATAKALTYAISEFMKCEDKNIDVIWMYTDGHTTAGGDPRITAEQLKTIMNVLICVAAIGNNVNMQEIEDIASPGCVFRFTSFSQYRRVMASVAQQVRGSTRMPAPVGGSSFGSNTGTPANGWNMENTNENADSQNGWNMRSLAGPADSQNGWSVRAPNGEYAQPVGQVFSIPTGGYFVKKFIRPGTDLFRSMFTRPL